MCHYLYFSFSSLHSYLAVPRPFDFLPFIEQKLDIFGCCFPLQWERVDAFKDARVPQNIITGSIAKSSEAIWFVHEPMNKVSVDKRLQFWSVPHKSIECIARVQKTYIVAHKTHGPLLWYFNGVLSEAWNAQSWFILSVKKGAMITFCKTL